MIERHPPTGRDDEMGPFGKTGKFQKCSCGHKEFVAWRFVTFKELKAKSGSALSQPWSRSQVDMTRMMWAVRDYWSAAGVCMLEVCMGGLVLTTE